MLLKKSGGVNLLWTFIGNFVQNHYFLDDDLSYAAVSMTSITKKYGLSLGDKYCLALAKMLKIPVYTVDRVWKNLENLLDIEVNFIR